VESGGRGAGTRITFAMPGFGGTRRFRMLVSEPEPGRRLVETDEASGIATSFEVGPGARPGTATVTIRTRYAAFGVSGWLERLLSPVFLRIVYASEFRLLAEAVAEMGGPPAPQDPATLRG
jgi:hypothetical protein